MLTQRMPKPRSPKLNFPFLLDAIQICRPKKPSSMAISPMPTAFISSLISESFRFSYPSFPDPPSTPDDSHSTKNNNTYLATRGPLKPSRIHWVTPELDGDLPSHEYFHNSPSSSTLTDKASPNVPSKVHNKGKTLAEKTNAYHETNRSSSSHAYNNITLKAIMEEDTRIESKKARKRETRPRTRRFKKFSSRDWKDSSLRELEHLTREQNPVSETRMVNKKANQSFVVVKRSVDPYEDFKKSMLEMILEKQIYEPKELEQLLMNFLSLNSRLHHRVILQAFTEIWKEVFSGSSNYYLPLKNVLY